MIRLAIRRAGSGRERPVQTAAAQPLEQIEAVEEQKELPVEDVPEVEPIEEAV